MPFIAESLFGNILHTENWQICKFSSFPNQSIYWNWQIEKLSLMTLTSQWSYFGPILNCNILESTRIQWIGSISASLNLLALALIISPTRTCNGYFNDTPLFSPLKDKNVIMKNVTRMSLRAFFYDRLNSDSQSGKNNDLGPLSIKRYKKHG